MAATSGIYLWTVFRGDEKLPLVYVGQAVDLIKRRRDYVQDWNRNSDEPTTNRRLHFAALAYGPSAINYDVLEVVDREWLTERERVWYWHFKALEVAGECVVANFVVPGENPMNNQSVVSARSQNPTWREGQSARARAQANNPVRIEAARASRIRTFVFCSPEGERIVVENLSLFCRAHSLVISGMHQVATGKRNHHKGWTLWTDEEDK